MLALVHTSFNGGKKKITFSFCSSYKALCLFCGYHAKSLTHFKVHLSTVFYAFPFLLLVVV